MLEIFTLAGRQCCKATNNIKGKNAIRKQCVYYPSELRHRPRNRSVWTNPYKAFVKRNSTVTLSKGIELKFSCRIAYTLLSIRLLLLIAHSLKKPKFMNESFLLSLHLLMCHQYTYIGNCNKDTWSITFYNCKVYWTLSRKNGAVPWICSICTGTVGEMNHLH